MDTTNKKQGITELERMMEQLREKLQKDPRYDHWVEERKRQEALEREEEEKERQRFERYRRRRDMEEHSIRYFLLEATCLRFDPEEKTPSAVMYEAYCRWCKEQQLFPETIRSFGLELKRNARKYQIAPTNFIWQGRHIRGFRGVAVIQQEDTTHA